jgi:hypothetical protein
VSEPTLTEIPPGGSQVETVDSTPGQWVALTVVGVIALLSSVAYPVYHRYTAHRVTLVVTTESGASSVVPPPDAIYSTDRDTQVVNRLAARNSEPILEDRIERYMSTVPAGTCRFEWTIRYSENSTDLQSIRTLVFADRHCR